MQSGVFEKGAKVLLVDDLPLLVAQSRLHLDLIKKIGGNLVGCAFLVELTDLNGRENIPNVPIKSLVSYN